MPFTLAQLRHFIALADSGSFTRGAGHTRRSQAAFSRSIAMLEAGLGAMLVERVGHRNHLTPTGRLVLEHAQQVVAQADELRQVVRHHLSGDAGQVRIALNPSPRVLLGGPLLAWAGHYPGGMKLTLSSGAQEAQLAALRDRRVDAVVTDWNALPAALGDLSAQLLCELPTALLARPGHALAQRRQLSLADFEGVRLASTGVSDAVARELVRQFGPQAHPDALFALCSDDVAALLETARGTDTVYVGILAPALQDLRQGTLVRLPLDTGALASRLAWVQRKGAAPNPVLQAVYGFVRERLLECARACEGALPSEPSHSP
ncbi:MAG: LysR family transcriptional regulator [Rhodoferax sp.]